MPARTPAPSLFMNLDLSGMVVERGGTLMLSLTPVSPAVLVYCERMGIMGRGHQYAKASQHRWVLLAEPTEVPG